MVSLFSVVTGQYPDSLSTMIVNRCSGSVFREVVGQGSGNIFTVVLR